MTIRSAQVVYLNNYREQKRIIWQGQLTPQTEPARRIDWICVGAWSLLFGICVAAWGIILYAAAILGGLL